MLNGAKPLGRFGSVNALGSDGVTSWKLPLKTSILPLWKSVAKRKFAPLLLPIARPLKIGFDAARPAGVTSTAVLPVRQARSRPASESKMNKAGAPETRKSLALPLLLKTTPVG